MKNITILAVDDEPFNLDLIEAVFSRYVEVKLLFAQSAQEAFDILKSSLVDVVLLDISMPQTDGIEALKIIRKEFDLPHLSILMVTANAEKEKEAILAGADDFIVKPFDVDILCARTLNYAHLTISKRNLEQHNKSLEALVAQRTVELQKAYKIAKQTEYEIAMRLGRASEFRDLETGGHIKRMSHYSKRLAELLLAYEKEQGIGADDRSVTEADCELLLYAAPLHDIGKVGIPDKILLKPGRFEPQEFKVMKLHAELGAKMLEGSDHLPVLKMGRIIALQHHEKWDGSGYPQGLACEQIDLFARIVAVADVFDALSSKRCYKEAMQLEKVLEIIKNGSGSHFEPLLVELLLKNLDQFLTIQKEFPDSDEEYTILDLLAKAG